MQNDYQKMLDTIQQQTENAYSTLEKLSDDKKQDDVKKIMESIQFIRDQIKPAQQAFKQIQQDMKQSQQQPEQPQTDQ